MVLWNRRQGIRSACCGFPLYLMGSSEFEPHAQKVIERLKATGAKELVTPESVERIDVGRLILLQLLMRQYSKV